MAKRSAQIVLDGETYTIPALNVGQLERLTEAFDGPASRAPYGLLRIAMERAEPHVNGGLDTIEPTIDEIGAAFKVIAELSGLTVNPPAAAAPTQS